MSDRDGTSLFDSLRGIHFSMKRVERHIGFRHVCRGRGGHRRRSENLACHMKTTNDGAMMNVELDELKALLLC